MTNKKWPSILFAFIILSSFNANSADVSVTAPYARETPAGARTGAVYLTITNNSAADDRLVSIGSDVAAKAQIHSMDMNGGMMHMAMMADGLIIPAGQTVTLSPSHMHIMLIGLKHQLQPDQKIHLDLAFEKAGHVPADAVVKPLNHD